ncbi:AraC family transcriptional regulator [Hydrogenispora ethanolica]|jgi:AraC-like DNA-binding protein|uniref:AraC family transcriptional regulator n=1 Tax=Hydrogenispora ethanolica TaxID=1082276 RepID=A0A4R1R6A7_HYDET|nr:AraC family transcriptional regulator [Hydrogenispora ethanolica]TCL60852.1 AraC family transcriptional regulator [Hydrogenispora ethanolica]
MSRYLYKVNDAFLPKSKFILYTPGPSAKRLPFRVTACGHFFATAAYEVEREGLNNCLLILTVSGTGEITYANRKFQAQKGQAFLIDCNGYHHYRTVGDEWEILWVRFDCHPEIDYLHLLNGDSFEMVRFENTSKIEKNIEKILELTQRRESTVDLSLSHLMSSLLTELSLRKQEQSASHLPLSAKTIISDASAFLEAHFAEEIHIGQLARNYFLSQYAFIRLFKKQTGLTPYEYLLKIRITEAKILLERSDRTINEIAGLVGFNNQNNFIRKFKLLVSTTPLRYRNLNR